MIEEEQILEDLAEELTKLIQNHPNFTIQNDQPGFYFDIRAKRGSSFLDLGMIYRFIETGEIRIATYADGWGYGEADFQLGDPDFMTKIIDWLIEYSTNRKQKRKRRA